MFRLWIERRFSRPVTAAGTVRIGRSEALCGAAAIIYVSPYRIILSAAPAGIVRCCRKKRAADEAFFPAPPDSSGVGWDPGLAGIGGVAVSP